MFVLDYGAERRRLRVTKMRDIAFRGGYHDFTIEHGGLSIFPRLIAAEHHKEFLGEVIGSGAQGMDTLLQAVPRHIHGNADLCRRAQTFDS